MKNINIPIKQQERTIELDELEENETDIPSMKLDPLIIKENDKKGETDKKGIKKFLRNNFNNANSAKCSLRKQNKFKMKLDSDSTFEFTMNRLERLMIIDIKPFGIEKRNFCSYCKKTNHTSESCRRQRSECFRCGSKDHKIWECPRQFPLNRLCNPKRRTLHSKF